VQSPRFRRCICWDYWCRSITNKKKGSTIPPTFLPYVFLVILHSHSVFGPGSHSSPMTQISLTEHLDPAKRGSSKITHSQINMRYTCVATSKDRACELVRFRIQTHPPIPSCTLVSNWSGKFRDETFCQTDFFQETPGWLLGIVLFM
jgi:hypothetical protein